MAVTSDNVVTATQLLTYSQTVKEYVDDKTVALRTEKADKVSNATAGNFAALDADGNLTDSGKNAADFATDAQGAKADAAVQGVKVNGTELSKDGNNKVDVPVPTASMDTPLKDGTASAGSSTQWARGDHRHPTDDSREAVANKSQTLDPTSTTEYPSSAAVGNFVNSSVATNTATFLGNFQLTDLGLTYPATEVQIAAALNNHVWPTDFPTNNDYVYVEIKNPQTSIDDKVQRYKYRDSLESWGYEYTLNNSSFTAEEKAAIDSGIDSYKVAAYDDAVTRLNNHVNDINNPHNVTKSQVGLGNVDNTSDADKPISTAQQTALDAKQDTISDLATIRSGALAGASALQPSGNGSDLSVTPDGTSTGYDLGSSTTLKAFTQKFKNLVGALKALAFKDKVSDSDISGTISDSHIASVAWSKVSSKPTKLSDFSDDITQQTYVATGTGSDKPASGAAVAQAVARSYVATAFNQTPGLLTLKIIELPLDQGTNSLNGLYFANSAAASGSAFFSISLTYTKSTHTVNSLEEAFWWMNREIGQANLAYSIDTSTDTLTIYIKELGAWRIGQVRVLYANCEGLPRFDALKMYYSTQATLPASAAEFTVLKSRDASWINSGVFQAARIPTSLPEVTAGASNLVKNAYDAQVLDFDVFNTTPNSLKYQATNENQPHAPEANDYYFVYTATGDSAAFGTQLAVLCGRSSPKTALYVRSKSSGTWTNWMEMANTGGSYPSMSVGNADIANGLKTSPIYGTIGWRRYLSIDLSQYSDASLYWGYAIVFDLYSDGYKSDYAYLGRLTVEIGNWGTLANKIPSRCRLNWTISAFIDDTTFRPNLVVSQGKIELYIYHAVNYDYYVHIGKVQSSYSWRPSTVTVDDSPGSQYYNDADYATYTSGKTIYTANIASYRVGYANNLTPGGTSGQYLKSNGAYNAPSWENVTTLSPTAAVANFDSFNGTVNTTNVVNSNAGSASTNPPKSDSRTFHVITTVGSNANYQTQLAIGIDNNHHAGLFYRCREGGTWYAWEQVLNDRPVSMEKGSPYKGIHINSNGHPVECSYGLSIGTAVADSSILTVL